MLFTIRSTHPLDYVNPSSSYTLFLLLSQIAPVLTAHYARHTLSLPAAHYTAIFTGLGA